MHTQRHRLNLRLDDTTYEGIVVMTRAGGYRSPCEMAKCILRMAVTCRMATTEPNAVTDDASEIAAIFQDLADAQAPRYGQPPKRHRTPKEI